MKEEEISALKELITGSSGKTLLISAIILLIVILLFAFSFKKSSKKNKEYLHNELNDYLNGVNTWLGGNTYHPSGNISYNGRWLTYSRGNRSININIKIEKETTLTPSMIEEWFKDKNYNMNEENDILNDIKNYLIQNGICKKVIISDDE